MIATIRILGIDPGLRRTGWGIVDATGSRLAYVACGTILIPDDGDGLAARLRCLHDALFDVIRAHQPDEAAVEETFVNVNPASTLKLGQARGVALLVPALLGMRVGEYAANLVKKTIVGSGHAEKQQIRRMVEVLLPKAEIPSDDAADALAIAITHVNHRAHAALAKRMATAR
jgi:crossover junction endodeoxyribonuclease RuvC